MDEWAKCNTEEKHYLYFSEMHVSGAGDIYRVRPVTRLKHNTCCMRTCHMERQGTSAIGTLYTSSSHVSRIVEYPATVLTLLKHHHTETQ